MDLKVIEEKQLVERYVRGRLTPPEARFFEQMVRGAPELADQLGLPEALQRTMRLLDDTGTEWRERTPRVWHRPWFVAALAAMTLLAVVAATSLWLGRRDSAARYLALKGEADRGLLIAPVHARLLALRAARPGEPTPTYRIGTRADPTMAELSVGLGFVKTNLFSVVVKRDDGTYWARLDNQLRDSNGDLRLAFNSAAFAAGTYDVEIDALDMHRVAVPVARLRLRIDPS